MFKTTPSMAADCEPSRWRRASSSAVVGATLCIAAGLVAGKETVIYSFQPGTNGTADGAYPNATLTLRNGLLFGTAEDGGTYRNGTVFAVTVTGKERVLHFSGGAKDGAGPVGSSLTNVNGIFYGTTVAGGAANLGTIFSISAKPPYGEKVDYSFLGGQDGQYPFAGVIGVGNSVLYGTTEYGGGFTQGGCTQGCGTVFSFKP